MVKKGSIFSVFLLLCASWGLAAEKLKFGISISNANYYMPATTALERGFWKEKGLEVEVIPFKGGAPTYRAVAAGEIKVAMVATISFVPAVAAGVPAVMVAQMMTDPEFHIWVKGDSPLKEPKDLKGTKVGVSRMGSATHVFATLVARGLGIEKEVKIVATGGALETIAALKAGIIQARPSAIYDSVELEARGEVRKLLYVGDYLPRPWVENNLLAEKSFARQNPDAVKRVVRGLLEGAKYVMANPGPIQAKMRSQYGYSEEVAKRIYGLLLYGEGGKIDAQALSNVREFLITYDLVKKERAPALSDLYTRSFTE